VASFRDRFWSRPVARAVTAPSSIVLAGAAAAVGIVATAPLALPVSIVAGVVAGGVAYGARVLAAVPRDGAGRERIDPFAVQEPWRRFVSDAQASRRRFDEAVRSMDKGPLRSRLEEIGARLDDGLQETWRVARRGHNLRSARSHIDVASVGRELAEAQARARGSTDPRAAATVAALQAQLDSARRMDAVVEDTITNLRLLDARLDEAVARAVELSLGAGDVSAAGGLQGDVDQLVEEMEALRVALDDAGPTASASPTS
jgi:hypothetical protein